MKRSRIKSRRSAPRRREAPRFEREDWDAANMLLWARSRDRCECCGTQLRGRIERHHRQRRRDGGDRLANLLYLLPEHHVYITEHPEWARERGLIVSALSSVDVADVPLLHWGEQYVLLDDDGGTRVVHELS